MGLWLLCLDVQVHVSSLWSVNSSDVNRNELYNNLLLAIASSGIAFQPTGSYVEMTADRDSMETSYTCPFLKQGSCGM
jgi:hypothetical protein